MKRPGNSEGAAVPKSKLADHSGRLYIEGISSYTTVHSAAETTDVTVTVDTDFDDPSARAVVSLGSYQFRFTGESAGTMMPTVYFECDREILREVRDAFVAAVERIEQKHGGFDRSEKGSP
jgi:hypothetical protein